MKSENYKKTEQARQAAHLKNMFEPKLYSQQWYTMYIACQFFTPSAQFISACLALGVPAYIGKELFGSWIIGLSIGLVVVVIFELMKRNIASTAAKLYYMHELTTKLKLSVAAFTVCSIVLSGFGTPILVKEFAVKVKQPIDTEVLSKIDSAKNAQVMFFENQKQEAKTAAANIHAQNNWRGVTVTAARSNILQLEQQVKSANDSMAAIISKHAVESKLAMQNADENYKIDKEFRDSKIEGVGWMFAAVCLLFEILFLVATFWLYDYNYHRYCELSPAILSKQAPKHSHEVASEAPQIGFNGEGKIISDGSKNMIICRKANGDLKAYDASSLSTSIKNMSGERKAYFEKMKRQLDNSK